MGELQKISITKFVAEKSEKFCVKKEMVFTKSFQFPSEEELTTEECPLGTPYLKAGAMHLGKHCEAENNEFVLCRHETRDPISCLKEGKVVTACANEFFKKVKSACAESFTQHAMCLEQSSGKMDARFCRKSQILFDNCMKESLNMPRPFYGYHSLVKVHQTSRPAPELEKPGWLLDERGATQGKADHLPDDFPRDTRGARLGNARMWTHH